MKGVVLAGGLGSRLLPLTKVTNKHLLSVYDRPMVFHPLEKLAQAGVKDVLLVTGGNHAGEFLRLLGDGRPLGLTSLRYAYQEKEGGIANALSLARQFVDNDRFVVVLGDNVFEDPLTPFVKRWEKAERGAMILLKRVPDPSRFGVAELEGGRVVSIEEKPEKPGSDFAQTGVYFYFPDVFKVIETLKPSGRGELEITDVNLHYLREGTLQHGFLEGWWSDAGTFESLYQASSLVREGRLKGKKCS